jgi:membrane-bound lytic murein transglycosylase D
VIENRRCWLALVVWVCVSAPAAFAAQDGEAFPHPKQLEAAVRFWTRVYTEADTHGGFIHDSENLGVVYETVHSDSASRTARRREVERAVRGYREILTKLGSGVRKGLSKEERRVLELWPEGTSNAEFRRAASRLRFQLGQSDRFRAGLARSGIWKRYIEQVLEANDMPLELAALPHVESSFDPTAYSKVGAAGMWQFTRSTGLRYMRIDHVVDERRDPYLSTHAATRLLKDNYEVLQSWPLAITAYNHGQAGMRRAASELGTTDIGVIVEKYKSRTFGFASRNFYAAFLAAIDIDAHPEKYFGNVALRSPLDTIVTTVPDYMGAETLARALGLRVATLRELNPALMDTVWAGDKFVPKDFPLRLPRTSGDAGDLLAAVPAGERYAAQQPDVQHRVRRGETLSQIASRYRVSLASLIRINGLRNGNFIRAGQVLALPISAGPAPATLADADRGAALADGSYVVRRGDSLDGIAHAFGVGVDDLLAANDIRNKNLIIAGQKLRLPRSLGDSAAAEVGVALAAGDADTEDEPVARAAVAEAGDEAVAVPAVASSEPVAVPVVARVAPEPAAVARVAPEPAAVARVAPEPAAVARVAPGPAAAGERVAPGPAAAVQAADAATEIGLDAVPEADDEEEATVTANEEASLDSNALASNQAELAADPSDYSIADTGTITVQSLETLGHYAEWLQIRTQRLRDINGLPFHHAVVIGQKLELDFSRVSPEEFEQRRLAYHQRQQEAFFSEYRIASIEDHVVRRGESLWLLALHTYDVPVWLLRQYNPDLDLDHISPGTVVKFPHLRPIGNDGGENDVEVSTADGVV